MKDELLTAGKSNTNSLDNVIEVRSKVSPFLYKKGIAYEITKNRACTMVEFRGLIKNGVFTDLHVHMLRVLAEYGYLNAYLIREAIGLNTNSEIDLEAPACRKLIKSLLSLGLLIQYSFYYIDNQGKKQGRPYIYTLSAAGQRFYRLLHIRKIKFLPKFDEPFEIVRVLEQLAFNQFHILMLNQYREVDILQEVQYYRIITNDYKVPGCYTIALKNGGILTLFVCAIRLNPCWHKQYLNKLRNIKRYLTENELRGCAILILCETEYQAMQAIRYSNCEEKLKDLEVFFVCDNSLVESNDVFDRLIEIPKDNIDSRRIFSLKFR